VHSVVSQGVIASYAQKLKVHAVCQRAASGQLLFLGSILLVNFYQLFGLYIAGLKSRGFAANFGYFLPSCG
jgi:hypothetical protein